MRDWYIDCAPAFQAVEVSLSLTFRSNLRYLIDRKTVNLYLLIGIIYIIGVMLTSFIVRYYEGYTIKPENSDVIPYSIFWPILFVFCIVIVLPAIIGEEYRRKCDK